MIFAVVNQKGGVGKTTISVNLAAGWSAMGFDILLLDTDPQGSVLQWQAVTDRGPFSVAHAPAPLKTRTARQLEARFDAVVVDTPPALRDITRSVLRCSQRVLVPIGHSPLDIWSGKETVELIARQQRRNPHLEARVLVCRKLPGTRLAREAREALMTYGLPVMSAEITQRVAYIEAMNAGLSVLTHSPRSPAADEIRQLCREWAPGE
jgi:chromosome partitioning protein